MLRAQDTGRPILTIPYLHCAQSVDRSSSTHLGLSWEMVGVADSLGFTVSGTMRRGAYTAIKDSECARVTADAWHNCRPSTLARPPFSSCVTCHVPGTYARSCHVVPLGS